MSWHAHDLIPRDLSRGRSRLALVLSTVVVALLCLVPWSGTAHAHGSVVDPASRNYGCWLRWGSDFQNPAMAQQDPMCWQAWQDNTNAMWNWNGLYRDGSRGNFRAVVPDGTLCSGGNTENGRYRSMDTPGAWKTTNVGSSLPSTCTTRRGTARTTSWSTSPSRASTPGPSGCAGTTSSC
ncbi:hypothetical protein STREPTOSP366_03860 [Streptomyces variabilis]